MERRRKPFVPNLRKATIALDANALDRIDAQRSRLVDEFLALLEELEIETRRPCGVMKELSNPGTPQRVREDMDGIFTTPTSDNSDEARLRAQIRRVLRGNSNSNKHDADADHVFEAQKYGCRFFVTHDRRISDGRLAELVPSIRFLALSEIVDLMKKNEGRRS